MPYKSEAQRRYFYAKLPHLAKKWEKHTPKGKKLPEHVAKAASLDVLQRVDSGAAQFGRLGGSGWAAKIDELQRRADEGDESALDLLRMLGVASLMVGAGAGMGAARLTGSNRVGLGAGLGTLAGAAPAMLAPKAKTPVLVNIDKAGKQVGATMIKSADLMKLDAKGISPAALQAIMQGRPDIALQHPGTIALVAQRKERIRRLKDEIKNPGMHLKREKPKAEAAPAVQQPPGMLPMAPGAPMPPSNHLGMFPPAAPQGAQAPMPGMATAAADERTQAFKYGFLYRVAELGMLPGELEQQLIKKAALMQHPVVGTVAAVGRGIYGGGAKFLKALRLALIVPPLLALPVMAGLGMATRHLTKPRYESPEELQSLERTALYKQLSREARLRARKLQQKRKMKLFERGEEIKEPTVEVPAIEAENEQA